MVVQNPPKHPARVTKQNNSPEKEEKSIDFQDDTYNRPSDEHHQNTSQKETGGFQLMPLEEEPKRPFQSNNKWETCDEQDLQTQKHIQVQFKQHFNSQTHLSVHDLLHSHCSVKAHTYISYGQECFIKEQNHPKEEEKHPEARQPHPDLC